MHPIDLTSRVKQKALALGFDLVGIAPPHPSIYQSYFHQWLAQGKAGQMTYLQNRLPERLDPSAYLPNVKSIICLAINYNPQIQPLPPASPPHGKIARYALGDDYHQILKPRLHALADFLKSLDPSAQTKSAVDTAPVMEKELAARTQLGWLGKNTCLINESKGSWYFLAEILTTLELSPDTPSPDRCGSCTRCLDACPTHALTPYQLDATKCISYQTIEQKNPHPPSQPPHLHNYLYGCDICQEVCPFNRKAPLTTHPEFTPRFPTASLNLLQVMNWNPPDYQKTLKNSPMKRVKLPQLKQTAHFLLNASSLKTSPEPNFSDP